MPEQGLLSLKGINSHGEWQVPMKSPQQQHLTQWVVTDNTLELWCWWACWHLPTCSEAFNTWALVGLRVPRSVSTQSACKRIVGKIRAHVKWDSRSCITWGAKLATHRSFRNRKLWLPLLSAVRLLKSVSNKFNLQFPNIPERKIKFTRSAFWLA